MTAAVGHKQGRSRTPKDMKRGLILDAARQVFLAEGLEGASLRAIALAAGYTPAALYFHFESKEAIYAEVLQESLVKLGQRVEAAVAPAADAAARLKAAALAFFEFYADNPRDLDLGFYLFRGGMRPKGLGRERDEALNAWLGAALQPIAAAAVEMGAAEEEAKLLMVDVFAHAAGLLLLSHTRRIRMFEASALDLMTRYVSDRASQLQRRMRDADLER